MVFISYTARRQYLEIGYNDFLIPNEMVYKCKINKKMNKKKEYFKYVLKVIIEKMSC